MTGKKEIFEIYPDYPFCKDCKLNSKTTSPGTGSMETMQSVDRYVQNNDIDPVRNSLHNIHYLLVQMQCTSNSAEATINFDYYHMKLIKSSFYTYFIFPSFDINNIKAKYANRYSLSLLMYIILPPSRT